MIRDYLRARACGRGQHWERATSAIALILLLSQCAFAADAADLWTLTTANFKTERVRLRAFNERGAEVLAATTGVTRQIPRDQFLELTRGVTVSPAGSGRFVAQLNSGDRFTGEPTATVGETIIWNSKALGEIKLSMRDVHAIARADGTIDPTSDPRTEDVIVLSNGDTVRGVIASVTNTGASIQPSTGGDATNVPLGSISAILFASTGGATTRAAATTGGATFRVTLADGTSLTVASPSLTEGALKLDAGAGSIASVPLMSVASVEQVNGPVIWLSSLAPSESVHTPHLDLSWPARMGLSVAGEPIRANGRAITHGIGVHSYSRLSWPIDRGVQSFRTQYAIDRDLPYADVTVRIKLDGKVVHEMPSLRAGAVSPIVAIDTGNARTITLEVDYGANADVQDRVNWIEPALLRYKSAPATQPNN